MALLSQAEEVALYRDLEAGRVVERLTHDEKYGEAMGCMVRIRAPLDTFFDKVTVNTSEPGLRRNRLRLLHKVRSTMDRIADFAKIEG